MTVTLSEAKGLASLKRTTSLRYSEPSTIILNEAKAFFDKGEMLRFAQHDSQCVSWVMERKAT